MGESYLIALALATAQMEGVCLFVADENGHAMRQVTRKKKDTKKNENTTKKQMSSGKPPGLVVMYVYILSAIIWLEGSFSLSCFCFP